MMSLVHTFFPTRPTTPVVNSIPNAGMFAHEGGFRVNVALLIRGMKNKADAPLNALGEVKR